MSYLVAKIVLCLLVALGTGFVLGWLVWRSIAHERERDLTTRWERRFGELERDRDTRVAKLRREVEDHREQIPTLEASLADRSDLIARLEGDLAQWREKVPALEKRLSEREADVAGLDAQSRESAARIDELDALARERAEEVDALRAAARKHAKALGDMETALRDSQQRVGAAREALEDVESRERAQAERIDTLERELADAVRAGQTAQNAQREAAKQSEAMAAERDALRRKADEATAEARRLTEQAARDERDRAALRERAEQREIGMTAARDEAGRSAKALSDAQEELRVVRAQLAAMEAGMTERNRELDALRGRRDRDATTLAERDRRIAELEKAAEKAARDRPSWLLDEAPPPGERDDLKKIRGVGPVLEKTMNRLGIWRYAQLARLGPADVRWLAEHINTFPDRITRDRWVEQAGRLHREKSARRA